MFRFHDDEEGAPQWGAGGAAAPLEERQRSRSRSGGRRPGPEEQAGSEPAPISILEAVRAAADADVAEVPLRGPGADDRAEDPRKRRRAACRWSAGESVALMGLRSKPELNGRLASVLQAPAGGDLEGRYLVRLEPEGQQLSVKRDNMMPATGAEGGLPAAEAGGSSCSSGGAAAGAASSGPMEQQAAGAGAGRWSAGDSVALAGLRSKPELNGRLASVLQAPAGGDAEGRYLVRLEPEGQQLSVKRDNMMRLAPAAEAAARAVAAAERPWAAARAAPGAGEPPVSAAGGGSGCVGGVAVGAAASSGSAERQAAGAAAAASARAAAGAPAAPAAASAACSSNDGEAPAAASTPAARPVAQGAGDRPAPGGPAAAAPAGGAPAPAAAEARCAGTSEHNQDSRVFKTNLEKLREKVAAEDAGAGARADRREAEAPAAPIVFVPAEEQPDLIRKVVVIYPDGKAPEEPEEDDNDEGVVPGQIRPPIRPPAEGEGEPAKPPGALAPPPAAAAQKPTEATLVGGQLKLNVSDAARQEDEAQRASQEKREAVEEKRRQMLAKLTGQMKLLLSRVQQGGLDDQTKEKYQDMVASVRAQMDKVSGTG